ncbi:fumarylacetoacetate hydrolase domain-containing protein 2A-like isoform X1 [Rhea pennata]|uniref:fumarylacetoacetate hydrolase domain-containing protein 2A-like isoform X1 n=1 Tax=Rhea pennata TaxID=8795 RepID=UPI002E2632B8
MQALAHGSRAMRLVQFRLAAGGEPRLGLQDEEESGSVVDLSACKPALPRTTRAFLETGDAGMAAAHRALESGRHRLPRADVTLLAPITSPDKVICVGLNYRDHCLEQDVKIPKEPIIFSKFPSAMAGPFDDIVHPAESGEVDWEVELAFVIGKKGKHITEAAALEHVAGFTVANDVSARDWQMRRNGRQWLLGKTFDTFCPLGPALVTKEAVADVDNLDIRCSVNGQLMQSGNTSQLIFKVPQLVAWVSRFVTLLPGDVFLTGTPPGVGVFRKPPVFLKPGDVVQCDIEGLGTIRNKVV